MHCNSHCMSQWNVFGHFCSIVLNARQITTVIWVLSHLTIHSVNLLVKSIQPTSKFFSF